MISRFIAFLVLVIIIYIGAVFLVPNFTDTYGSKNLNEKIRMFKRETELDRVSNTTGSLIEKTKDIARPYIDESKDIVNETQNALNQANTVVNEKAEQAKQAIQSAQDTYNKAQETKNKIEDLTKFGTGR